MPQALLALAPFQISKWRYNLTLPGGDWVVDVFEADNAPLVLAEVELASARPVAPPAALVRRGSDGAPRAQQCRPGPRAPAGLEP